MPYVYGLDLLSSVYFHDHDEDRQSLWLIFFMHLDVFGSEARNQRLVIAVELRLRIEQSSCFRLSSPNVAYSIRVDTSPGILRKYDR